MLKLATHAPTPACPRCGNAETLRLHATLPEADDFPEVQCFECRSCGEVLVIERELRSIPLRGMLPITPALQDAANSTVPQARVA
jgi:hypothetical protein